MQKLNQISFSYIEASHFISYLKHYILHVFMIHVILVQKAFFNLAYLHP